MMGYITIPKIGVKLAIYHTVDDAVLQVGVGTFRRFESYLLEVVVTHCVLSSHRGTS